MKFIPGALLEWIFTGGDACLHSHLSRRSSQTWGSACFYVCPGQATPFSFFLSSPWDSKNWGFLFSWLHLSLFGKTTIQMLGSGFLCVCNGNSEFSKHLQYTVIKSSKSFFLIAGYLNCLYSLKFSQSGVSDLNTLAPCFFYACTISASWEEIILYYGLCTHPSWVSPTCTHAEIGEAALNFPSVMDCVTVVFWRWLSKKLKSNF